MPNHLAGETSPYLLQHASNPVDWYPWGPAALARAQKEDKPIFLSIGYSACHWCHVMEKESFTDPHTANFLNKHFISIKVDREERPDLDAIYMEAVTALTGHGGWPLSAWLTAEGTPFYGGTYFPDSPGFGMPSFLQVLEKVSEAWEARRGEVQRAAATLLAHLTSRLPDSGDVPSRQIPSAEEFAITAQRRLDTSFDRVNGGWGRAPKFPQPMVLEAMLAWLLQGYGDQINLRGQIARTLDAMADGGIYDQVGGGFHRYSTDERWRVPHFEKMLYDNAQLARCYLHAWQLLKTARYRTIAEEIFDYLLREMRHPDGGFFSAEDADSEGKEGAFYVWTKAELRQILGVEQAEHVAETYDVTAEGNFEGANVLHVAKPEDDPELLRAARAKLRAARDARVHPSRDDKVLAGWNGLTLAAFAEAARALPSEKYLEAARLAGDFLLRALMQPNHRVFRSWKDGVASGNGFLEDYASLAEGFLALYQTTFAEHWFAAARGLGDAMIEHFRRPEGGFYDTSSDHERLITRPRSIQDSPTPSGNSLAITVLARLAAYTGESHYQELAEAALGPMEPEISGSPVAYGQWLSAYQLIRGGTVEVAVVGDMDHPSTRALLSVMGRRFAPTQIGAARSPGRRSIIPLLEGRDPQPGEVAASWVCRRQTCDRPTSDPQELAMLLGPTLG